MFMSMSRYIVLVGALLFILGCGGGIVHTNIITVPADQMKTVELSTIGEVTSIRQSDSTVFVAGSKGIAAVTTAGEVLWTTELPAADMRFVDADQNGVAFTSYSVTGIDPAKGARGFLANFSAAWKTISYTGATVGTLSLTGELLWTKALPGESVAASPPALTPGKVGVTLGYEFAIYDRQTGTVTQQPLFSSKLKGATKSFVSRTTRMRPIVWQNDFYAPFAAYLLRTDTEGKEKFKETNFGLFNPIENVTAPPILFNNQLMLGLNPSDKLPTLQAISDKPDLSWKRYIKDKRGAVGSFATNNKKLFAATNFHVAAFDEEGDLLWDAVNKKGGLYPGRYRKVTFLDSFGTRQSPNVGMVATDKQVLITSPIRENVEGLTVLSVDEGEYIASLDMGDVIVDLAIVTDKMIVAMPNGLKIVPIASIPSTPADN